VIRRQKVVADLGLKAAEMFMLISATHAAVRGRGKNSLKAAAVELELLKCNRTHGTLFPAYRKVLKAFPHLRYSVDLRGR